MPHVASEVELILNNLLPYLQHKYGDEVREYFTESAKRDSKDDCLDEENKQVVCEIDMYLEEEEEDELGLEEARVFITNQK